MTLPDAMELARLNGELGLALTEALVEIDRLRQIDRLRLAATPAPLDARCAALVAAVKPVIDAAIGQFPEEWIEADSSMAMPVTLRGRDVFALRAALDGEPGVW